MKQVELMVLDTFHKSLETKWVLSESFLTLTDFIYWVLQHQKDLSGVIEYNETVITDSKYKLWSK